MILRDSAVGPRSVPTISVRTAIPGPASRACASRAEAAIPRGVYHASPVYIERASGATVTDVDGNVLLDFTGGLGVLNVGHASPEVVDAIVAQAHKVTHTCVHVAMHEPYVAVAERLNALVPGVAPKKTVLVNSGAEAVENAVKIARYFTGRPAVVTFEHAFAGRTLLALTLTSKVMPYKHGFGPFAPEVYRLPYPYRYRAEVNDEARFIDAAIDGVRTFFRTQVDPRQVACVVMELVLGEGGFVVAPPAFVHALVETCRAHGILLVIDEIQTGFGRTGRLFASEHYDIVPDLVTTAKSLAGGMVLGAVTGRAEIMDSVHVGGLGGTFGGNPVSCAAALATLDRIEALGLVARGAQIGARLAERLESWRNRHPNVGDARGLGAMRAVELVLDKRNKTPAAELTSRIIERSAERGVLLISAGTWSNVLRFLVPLVISDDQLDEGLDVIEAQLFDLAA
jgi:4-aminobutyrate aminotransferase/(S)-3-amino-2-methylpropionate transaminase